MMYKCNIYIAVVYQRYCLLHLQQAENMNKKFLLESGNEWHEMQNIQ